MELREFRREDNIGYRCWFENDELNSALGPAWTDEELDEVLSSRQGCDLVGIQDGRMVGVVGIVFPDDEHPEYIITAIAVRPSLRGRGIGKEMVREVLRRYPLKPGQSWIAFTDVKNPGAKRFFESIG